jgi:predicted DNA-binding protein with PD1-like motif
VFAIRLEHGEPMPESLERLAAEKGVQCGLAVMVGGADEGSRFVVGPEDGEAMPVVPMVSALGGVHEVAAVGTLFPDETGKPILHMHAAFGRGDRTLSGCIREGIVTWQVLEIILVEIVGLSATRVADEKTGFSLLQCEQGGAQP